MGILRRLFGGSDDLQGLDAPLQLPAAAVYTHWDVGPAPVSSLEFHIGLHDDPGTIVGEYFAPWNGTIDGCDFYLGIQTDLLHPQVGWTGKGALFSTWWTFDLGDTRCAPDGFYEQGTHEGRFVGVRRNLEWTPGEWVLRLDRGEADRGGDWFDMRFGPAGVEPAWIGALRFARRDPSVPAAIAPHGTGFVEVYANAATYAEIAEWHVDAMAYGEGRRARAARSEYPWYRPGRQVPNATTWYDPERDRVHARIGGTVARAHPPGQLF
jgi:hypothetical protein